MVLWLILLGLLHGTDNLADCVSFKPNSTEILVQNLHCNGSHGISVGSLGQYKNEVDIVKNVLVYNISMFNASVGVDRTFLINTPTNCMTKDGARIKVWPGVSSAMSTDLQGGGGSGSVQNITYDTMTIDNVDYAIEVTQCYGQKNLTLCNEYPVCPLRLVIVTRTVLMDRPLCRATSLSQMYTSRTSRA